MLWPPFTLDTLDRQDIKAEKKLSQNALFRTHFVVLADIDKLSFHFCGHFNGDTGPTRQILDERNEEEKFSTTVVTTKTYLHLI